VVARLHARRKVDFRKARRLGKNDGLFVWTKSYQHSEILSATQWSLLPAQITVRIIRPNRQEPRAVKRRSKPYPLLNQPHRRFVEISHRSRYWKGRPRNYRSLN
jgi:hypothetical protein